MTNRTRKVLVWAALAYFWSLINDNPVNADVLLGSRGYLLMEVVLNLLSFSCFLLAVREALKGRGKVAPRSLWRVGLWTVLAFLSGSVDDIPPAVHVMRVLRTEYWYPTEIAMYGASLFFFYLAIRESNKGI